jgi:putative ABC transport system permease protein
MRLSRYIPTETIAMALGNVRAHKFRSFLTVLGIVIGIMTVISVASLLTGLRSMIVGLVEEYGTNNIYAFHLSTGFTGPQDRREFNRKPLTPEDGVIIGQQATAVEDVASVLFVGLIDTTLHYERQTYKRGNVQAVTPNHARTTNLILSEGRYFSDVDNRHRRDVMVVGVNVAEALFPHKTRAAGTRVLMGGREFEIVGVLEKRKNAFFGENEEDNAVLIPLETGHKVSPQSEFVMLIIRARTGQIATALDQVEQILRRQRGVRFNDRNDFDLSTADKFIEQFDSITAAVGMIAIAISGVGLLVGGIGVMNIMLMSVTERTAEIGIRKAIGARRKDIVSQFLFEAMTLTLLGGILGVVLSIVLSYVLKFFLPTLPAAIPLWAVLTGLIVSTVTGLLFGVWPATKAARLDPIECLRYE